MWLLHICSFIERSFAVSKYEITPFYSKQHHKILLKKTNRRDPHQPPPGKTDAVNTSNIVTRPQSRINRPNSLDTYVNRTTIPLIVYLIWFLLQYSDGIQRILVLPAHLISSRAPGMCAVAFSGLKDHWYGHTGFGVF